MSSGMRQIINDTLLGEQYYITHELKRMLDSMFKGIAVSYVDIDVYGIHFKLRFFKEYDARDKLKSLFGGVEPKRSHPCANVVNYYVYWDDLIKIN